MIVLGQLLHTRNVTACSRVILNGVH